MSLLVESIKLQDGKFRNLFYHEQRMIRSLSQVCGSDERPDLEHFLSGLDYPPKGLYKCRIIYDDTRKDVEFVPYEWKPPSTLRIVEHDRISYEFKFQDRKLIERLFNLRGECDDILVVKKGYVTDTSFANIAFRRGRQWFTPWSALLKGTQRQKLLNENQIREEEIKMEDIRSFDTFRLINAMFEFDGPELDVRNIIH